MTHEQRTRVAVVGTEPRWGPEHARVDAELPPPRQPHPDPVDGLDMLVHLCGADRLGDHPDDRQDRPGLLDLVAACTSPTERSGAWLESAWLSGRTDPFGR